MKVSKIASERKEAADESCLFLEQLFKFLLLINDYIYLRKNTLHVLLFLLGRLENSIADFRNDLRI